MCGVMCGVGDRDQVRIAGGANGSRFPRHRGCLRGAQDRAYRPGDEGHAPAASAPLTSRPAAPCSPFTVSRLWNPSSRSPRSGNPRTRLALGLLLTGFAARAATAPDAFPDPAPPEIAAGPAPAPVAPVANPEVVFRGPPRPPPAGARGADWPHFLGPAHNQTSPETGLRADFPPGGPGLVGAMPKGEGDAAPVGAGERLVVGHRCRLYTCPSPGKCSGTRMPFLA